MLLSAEKGGIRLNEVQVYWLYQPARAAIVG